VWDVVVNISGKESAGRREGRVAREGKAKSESDSFCLFNVTLILRTVGRELSSETSYARSHCAKSSTSCSSRQSF
jgi:hypothetical protein